MRGLVWIFRHGMHLLVMLALPATAVALTTPSIVDLSNDEPEAQQPQRPPLAAPQPPQLVQAPVKPSPSANPLWGVPLKQLSNTRDRPIFSPSRRPPPAVVAAPPAAVAPPVQKPKESERPQLSLLGTILNGKDGYGIFMDQAAKAPVRVRVGASYQGWTLRSLQAGAATIGKGLENIVLEFPKRAGDQKNGLNKTISATTAKWPFPGGGLTADQPPRPNPSPQPVRFPPEIQPAGNRPPPPAAVRN